MTDQPDVDVSSLRAALDRANATVASSNSEIERLRGTVAERDRKLSGETLGRMTAEEAAVDNAITAKESERDQLKAEVARLNEEGKYAEAADAAYRMSEVAADLRDYRGKKTYLATARENARTQPRAEEQPQQPAARKAWFDAHPQFFSDKKFNAKAMALHAEAISNDLAADSPEYFAFIDDGLAGDRSDAAPQRREAAERTAADDAGEITVDSPLSQPREAAVITADARAEKPQPRAAGPGSFAAAPGRSARPSVGAEQKTTRLNPDQADTAIRLAATLQPELRAPADIYKWYAELLDTQSVRTRMSGAA